jgi:hypothetical protein
MIAVANSVKRVCLQNKKTTICSRSIGVVPAKNFPMPKLGLFFMEKKAEFLGLSVSYPECGGSLALYRCLSECYSIYGGSRVVWTVTVFMRLKSGYGPLLHLL